MVIKIRFALIIIYPMRPCVICKRNIKGTCDTEKKDGVLLCNDEKNLPKKRANSNLIYFNTYLRWAYIQGGEGLIIGDGLTSGGAYRAFSLTWRASMLIYWNKRKRLHKKRVQLPQVWFGTPTWPPFHCFGTPIWPPWRHVKTLYYIAKNRKKLLIAQIK